MHISDQTPKPEDHSNNENSTEAALKKKKKDYANYCNDCVSVHLDF